MPRNIIAVCVLFLFTTVIGCSQMDSNEYVLPGEYSRLSLKHQLDGGALKQPAYIPSATDYAALEKEHEKLKKLYAEQALEREILRDLLKKTNPHLRIK